MPLLCLNIVSYTVDSTNVSIHVIWSNWSGPNTILGKELILVFMSNRKMLTSLPTLSGIYCISSINLILQETLKLGT